MEELRFEARSDPQVDLPDPDPVVGEQARHDDAWAFPPLAVLSGMPFPPPPSHHHKPRPYKAVRNSRKSKNRGAWVGQSVKWLTGSGHDLVVHRFEPHLSCLC